MKNAFESEQHEAIPKNILIFPVQLQELVSRFYCAFSNIQHYDELKWYSHFEPMGTFGVTSERSNHQATPTTFRLEERMYLRQQRIDRNYMCRIL